MKTRQLLALASSCVVIVIAAAMLSATAASEITSAPAEKKVQVVKLTFDAKGYVVTPSTVTRGIPVRMEVDLATVKGCMRTVVINAFNVKKTVKEGDTIIEFTPTRTGPIQIICGMNMGKGSFTVVEPVAAK